MLKKRDRLTTRDIESLSLGKSVFGTLVSLRFMPAKKLGFSVAPSKKSVPRAVDRIRIRRRIYSILEKIVPNVKKHYTVMIMPKKECLNIPFNDLSAEINSVFAKAGLLGR